VQIADPPVTAACSVAGDGTITAGGMMRVRAVHADVTTGTVELAAVDL
jgi:hypothetical protein